MYHILRPILYCNSIRRIRTSVGYGINHQRFYCNKDDENSKCPKPKASAYKTIRPDSSECHPDRTTKFDLKQVQIPKKPVPSPCEPNYEAEKRKYRMYAILGTVIFISAIVYAYLNRKDKPQMGKPVVQKGIKRKRTVIKDPEQSSEIPKNVHYLLIGGGTASFSAFRAIKSADPTAEVLVISNETHLPYMRPPLSKEMWFHDDRNKIDKLMFKQWNGSERSLFYEPDDFYIAPNKLKDNPEHGGVAVARGWNVSRVDPFARKAYLEDGYEISYEKCLIATGAIPKTLDIFEYAEPKLKEHVQVFRNIPDFYDIFDVTEDVKAVAVIGGGFLGSELSCALARFSNKQFRVYQIFREKGNMARILPDYLSEWTTDKVRNEGVQVMSEACITSASIKNDEVILKLNTGDTVTVDQVILAVGVKPNTHLAEISGLEVDPDLDGYLVNTELEARSDLYAAGDCACFFDTKLGRRRVEHHDHAVVSGRLAGENMTGARRPYWHQSMFWSDLGPDVGYEAIGIVDASLPTVGVFTKASKDDTPQAVVEATNESIRSNIEDETETVNAKVCAAKQSSAIDPIEKEDFGKGVIFYLKNDIVVGIVLWNVFNRMSVARQVLKSEKKYEDLNEVAKLFNIHEDE